MTSYECASGKKKEQQASCTTQVGVSILILSYDKTRKMCLYKASKAEEGWTDEVASSYTSPKMFAIH